MKKYLIVFLTISGIVLPAVSFAGFPDFNGPLVICGREGQDPCTLCDIFKMVQKMIDFIIGIIGIFAPIFIAVGGFMILLGGATPEQVNTGKKIIKSAIIGLIIALVAWTGVNMIFNTFVSTDTTKFPGPWNEIKCEGGGINEESVSGPFCCCDVQGQESVCRPEPFDSTEECNSRCTNYCGDQGYGGEDYAGSCCLNEKLGSGQTCGGTMPSNYCCCNLKDGTYHCRPDSYDTMSECGSRCANYCKGYGGNDYSSHCCVEKKEKCVATESCQQSFSVGSSSGCTNISDCVDISNYTSTHGCESNNGICLASSPAATRIQSFISKFNSLSGGACALKISSTIQVNESISNSSCHKPGTNDSGTCVDFNLTPYSTSCRDFFYKTAKDYSLVVSFLDEYVDTCKPSNATGGNIHTKF